MKISKIGIAVSMLMAAIAFAPVAAQAQDRNDAQNHQQDSNNRRGQQDSNTRQNSNQRNRDRQIGSQHRFTGDNQGTQNGARNWGQQRSRNNNSNWGQQRSRDENGDYNSGRPQHYSSYGRSSHRHLSAAERRRLARMRMHRHTYHRYSNPNY